MEEVKDTPFGNEAVEGQEPTPVALTAYSMFSTIQLDSPNISVMYPMEDNPVEETPPSPMSGKRKKPLPKKQKSIVNCDTKAEESCKEVKEAFKKGCQCHDANCFKGLNPESVRKHRLNIAKLTKSEQDMYLMGVTMASMSNPKITVKDKERQRLRAQYVYQGRRVCLDAFVYLQNCSHYQLKSIRKHVMTQGVTPRIHGNQGKKPHNALSSDIYCHATNFLKQNLEKYADGRDIGNTEQPIQLPKGVTRKKLYNAYVKFSQALKPKIQLMGYTTFHCFFKEKFPHVKFCKVDLKGTKSRQNQQQTVQESTVEGLREQQIQTYVIDEAQQVIPLVVAQQNVGAQHDQQTFLLTPVSQIIASGPQDPNGNVAMNGYYHQMTNAGYVVDEQGNVTQQPYTLTKM